MANEKLKEEGGEQKPETKEEKKARKAKEKEEKKKAKAAKKAGGAATGEEGGEATATEGAEGTEGEATAETPKSKKKLIIIIAVAVLVLGGAGVFLSGMLGGGGKDKEEGADALTKEQILYHDLDEFLVNLNNPGTQVSFLKAVITVELPNQLSLNEIQEKMPRIRDLFQVYLRELRNSDLQGSAGLQRLRTELLLRINSVMEKGKVNNILFKEILIQ